jgi:hypothetical protein
MILTIEQLETWNKNGKNDFSGLMCNAGKPPSQAYP